MHWTFDQPCPHPGGNSVWNKADMTRYTVFDKIDMVRRIRKALGSLAHLVMNNQANRCPELIKYIATALSFSGAGFIATGNREGEL